jgi:putative CocE/NonD family hydrolase
MLAVALAACAVPVAAQDLYRVRAESDVSVPMRDGVKLMADVYRPDAEGRFPVILQRTPYNRADPATGVFFASHGYVVVLQDVRGRYASEGEFYPFRNEGNDGYDTIEWAAALPYSDGKVGMFGGSYVGATQMLAAMAKAPHLVSIQPYVTASDYYEGWTYQGGARMHWFNTSWTTGLTEDTLQRKATALAKPKDWVETTPAQGYKLLELPTPQELAPYYADWLKHETSDDYWRAIRVKDHYPEMTVKGLHAAGWHDIFSRGSIENFIGLRQSGATEEARLGQRLLVGPWAHASTSPEGKVGDVSFGTGAVFDTQQMLLEWADYTLKGESNSYASSAPVRIFVMGDNVWRDEQDFPLARAKQTRYYLHSTKGARSASGDGVLATVAPKKGQKPDSYEYDPANPVRTIGGRLCCGQQYAPGPFDQEPNESRDDVLVFSTPPLAADTEVTGFISAELFASSSAVDTDFTAMLVDVDPSGYARYLGDGIVRARYRNGTDKAVALEPGKIERYTVDLWATSNVFKAGHRIRLYVSSSNFPRFDRNPNTGEPTATATGGVKAKQALYHDALHPSALVLPVVPRS